MVAQHAIIYIEFLQMVKIANYINITVINYTNNVILYNINIIIIITWLEQFGCSIRLP